MGCSRPDRAAQGGEDGFATAAATMISLALAVVAAAATATAIMQLTVARSDFTQDQLATAIDGVQAQAAFAVSTADRANRLRWIIPSAVGPAHVLAEAEGAKLSPAAASVLGETFFARFGVADTEELQDRLKALNKAEGIGPGLEGADAAPLWRSCARSLISVYGDAKVAQTLTASVPFMDTSVWHVGDVWRVRASLNGWVDDRTVRISGDGLHPAQTIDRRFYRASKGDDQCDALFAS